MNTRAVTGFWVAGERVIAPHHFDVHSPWDESLAGSVSEPGREHVERAIELAVVASEPFGRSSAYERAHALTSISQGLAARKEEFARTITSESGKPIKWARLEVDRAISTFRWAAEEARQGFSEAMDLDTDPGANGRIAIIRRVSRGPILGITPFNFPLNLVAHKVAPAIAAGAPIILKPAPATPLTALLLGELLAEADLPVGSWSILPVPNEQMNNLVEDPRLPTISFTGSVPVGWAIRDRVPRKHVTLELGGNAAVYVAADWADLRFAATRIALFAVGQAGQSCISVQRVYVHADVFNDLSDLIVEAVNAVGVGSPWDDSTDVGPMISRAAANRVDSWVTAAVELGANRLTGGQTVGTTVAPTVMTDVDPSSPLLVGEVFGPVMSIVQVKSDAEALTLIDDSVFGLQTGIFTNNVPLVFDAFAHLHVGGIIIGDVPSFRADQMPYGGMKDSGTGREGLKSAIADFTEDRVLVLNTAKRDPTL